MSENRLHTSEVDVPAGEVMLNGMLTMAPDARAIVVFAHGNGPGRASVCNRQIADMLHEAGVATLELDLLTERERQLDLVSAEYGFNVDLLAGRLVAALDWLYSSPDTESLAVGLLGTSTGAAAALVAASVLPDDVAAVVSRGGRADLAGDALALVEAPTLLIVGALDEAVVDLTQFAASRMQCEHRIMSVADATHRFEEPGTLDHAARLACDWFLAKLMPIGG
jgi:dienelactone hydrolase